MKFELARVVYPIKKYHLRCLKWISNAGFPGNPEIEIPTESDQTVFFIGFRMVDLVGNRFLIIKILKHKKMPNNLNSGIQPTDNRFLNLGKVEINSFWKSKYLVRNRASEEATKNILPKVPSPLFYNRVAVAGTVCTSRTDNQSDTGTELVWKAGRGNMSRTGQAGRLP